MLDKVKFTLLFFKRKCILNYKLQILNLMKPSSLENLTLRYIDEEQASLLQSNSLNSYPIMPKNEINFEDIFQIDQSEVDSQKTKSRFFTNNNLKINKQEKQQLTIYLKQNLGNIKARRRTIHHIPPAYLMRSISNVSLPNNFSQLIRFFLKSKYFIYLITFAALLNLVGIIIIDYSFRIESQLPQKLSKMNNISLALQMVANWVFTFQICMKIYQSGGNMKQPYLITNMIGTFATWATIFFDMMEYDANLLFRIMVIIRIVRAIVRIIEITSWLRSPFEIFIKTIPSLQKLFFPFVIIILFYAFTGMALFNDSVHYMCVGDSQNSHSTQGSYCGSSMFHCHQGQTCKYIQELPQGSISNQYNLVRFNSIGNALLTVFHYIFNSNFHVIRSKFSYFINPYISSIYFVSMSIFLFYIIANLIMISMSKAYMEQIEHYRFKKQSQIEQVKQDQARQCVLFQKILKLLNFLLAVVQTIVLALTYQGISQSIQNLQSLLDFILSWTSLCVIIALIIFQRRHFFKDPINFIDLITLLFHFLSLIICLIRKQSVIYSLSTSSQILRSIKALRIIRLLYFKQNLFKYQKYVIKVFFQTIYKVKSFVMLCLCFALMFKLLGQLFFAYLIRFTEDGKVDVHNGQAYGQNFQSFSASLYTILYLFLNERWSQIMYFYYQATGWVAVWYFVVVVFISHMMLIRLYIAVFLSYFKQELHKKSKQEMIKEKNIKTQQIREIARKATLQHLQHEQSSKNSQLNQIKEQQDQFKNQNKGCKWPLLQVIYHSDRFSFFINATILVHCLTIILKNVQNQKQKIILNDIEFICLSIYISEVLIGCLVQGISFNSENYFVKNKSNFISFLVALFAILSFIPFGAELATLYLRRITILKVFTFFRQTDKQMSIVVDTIFNIIHKFLNFLIIYALLLCVIALIPLKLLHNSPYLFDCKASPFYHGAHPHNQAECLALGGNWFENQHFSNIFTSVALMYQLVSSQSWTVFIQTLISGNKPFGWQLFFILLFFVYNICFLGIVMGFIVQTYIHLKDKAYNLNLLKPSQKCWILIKNSINCLKPKTVINLPSGATSQRKFIFELVTSQRYNTVMDYLPYLNAIMTVLFYNKNSLIQHYITQYFRNTILFVFSCDVLLKLYAHRLKFLELNNSYIELLGGIFIIIYCIATQASNLGKQSEDIYNGILIAILLLRCKSLLLKYSWCKTNLNSVIDILPKCAKIIKLVCAVLFFYAAIGLQLFKNVLKNHLVDNYNFGFDDFLTAILTLVKVIVSQSWFQIVSGFIQHSNTKHICHDMFDYGDFKINGPHACGSWIAYPYFLSFHVLMVLLVMNLLIATMASAYDDNYQIQYNSVNIFQLEQCLSLWQKYDPMATGVVQYKKFWRLTSQIAILFGISKKKLIKRKNKFFQELDLQIYQNINSPMLCYRFHDVITKFSKIKLQVANLRNNQNPSQHEDNEVDIEFDISPVVLKQIRDYVTPFPDHLYTSFKPFKSYKSGQTKYIFGILKKIRHWKHISTEKKRPRGGAKLSSIFQLASKKHHNFDLDQSGQFGLKQL